MDIIAILGKIGFDWQVALANTINFLIVFFLLKQFAFKPIKAMIEKRQSIIQKGLDKAEEAEVRLKEIDNIGKVKIKDAEQKVLMMMRETEERAKKKDKELEDRAEKKKVEINNLLRDNFLKQQEAANKMIYHQAADLVKAVIVKTVELKPESIDDALIKKAAGIISENNYEKR